MSNINDTDYMGILLEEIRDQNRAVLEAVGQMQDTVKTLATKQQVEDLAETASTIQKAVTATNRDVTGLDGRVGRLEARTV